MTSKRGENKEVRYEPQASSVTDVLTSNADSCSPSEEGWNARHAVCCKEVFCSPTSHSSSPGAASVSQMSSSRTPSGPLKRDGTPDMRYAVKKSPHASPVFSGYSSSGSMSSLSGSVSRPGSYGPL